MQRGSTLIETLIYIFIFTLLTGVVVSILFSLSRSYAIIQSSVALEMTAESALERMARDTRDAISIDTGASVFGSSPGVLTLNSLDENGVPIILEFFITSQSLHLKQNGFDLGPLSGSKARVTSLIIRPIYTANSQAVRIEMTIESGAGLNLKSRTFYTTAVLRGSYTP